MSMYMIDSTSISKSGNLGEVLHILFLFFFRNASSICSGYYAMQENIARSSEQDRELKWLSNRRV